jgi:4-hydroxythreonine-4-phosphate dehydrogenase
MLKVGITHGDINGISYEVIIKALEDERMCELCTPIIFGSAKLIGYYKKVLGIENFAVNQVNTVRQAKDGVVNLVNIVDGELKVDMGKATAEAGRAAVLSLDAAVEALKEGSIDVLVTAPINKHAIHSDLFPYTGHTEYLQAKLGAIDEDVEDEEEEPTEDTSEATDNAEPTDSVETSVDATKTSDKALMILFKDNLRMALVTNHLAVSEIAAHLTENLVYDKIKSFNTALIQDFGLTRPRIAVLSLNPHGGDDGLLGDEETRVIKPAIKSAFDEEIMAFGPFPSDGFFGSGTYRNFDGVLAMYHDQGLTPFKLEAGADGVNFTAGLKYVRTSPDHGTGYDIAGKGEADATSMRHAIYEACDIYRRRKTYLRSKMNPLRKQYVERGADKTIDLSKEPEPEI